MLIKYKYLILYIELIVFNVLKETNKKLQQYINKVK